MSRNGSIQLEQQPLGAVDDLDVLILQGVFQHGDRDGSHLGQPGLRRFAHLRGLIAELLQRGSWRGPGAEGRRRARRRVAVRTSFLGGGKTSRSTASSIAGRERWTRTTSSFGSKSAWPYSASRNLHHVLAKPLAGEPSCQCITRHFPVGGLGRIHGVGTSPSFTGGPSITAPFLPTSSASRAAVVMKRLPFSVIR